MSVHSLHSDVPPGEPDQEIIDRLEFLLDEARAGEIRAIAFVAIKDEMLSKTWFKAHAPFGHHLLGRLHHCALQIATRLEAL